MIAGVTLVHVTAEGRGPAGGKVTQDLFLGRRWVVRPTIVIPMGAHHVGDLEARTHGACGRRGSAEDARGRRAEQVEWAAGPPDMLDADVRIDRSGAKRRVAEQGLYHGDVGAGLQ